MWYFSEDNFLLSEVDVKLIITYKMCFCIKNKRKTSKIDFASF